MATAYLPGAARPSRSASVEALRGSAAALAVDLAPAAVAARLVASGKRQALAGVAEIAARAYRLDAARVLDALIERERLGSTGVGQGVAVPHVRLDGLERLVGVFARLAQPVEFGSVDEQPVDLIYALLAPAGAHADHLRALARVARRLRGAPLRQALRRAADAQQIRALLVD